MKKQKNSIFLMLSLVFIFVTSPVRASNFADSLSTSYIFLGIILFLGFLGLVMAVFTSNLGLGLLISVFSFGAFFILNGGDMTSKSYVFNFILGITLLILEVIIPGFTVAGIVGIVLVSLSIVMTVPNISYGIIMLVTVLIAIVAVVAYLFKKGYTNGFIDKLILKETHMDRVDLEEKEKHSSKLLGREGEVITDMRPSGTIDLDGEYIDAISEGLYIKKGERVKVVKVEGNKITVRRI